MIGICRAGTVAGPGFLAGDYSGASGRGIAGAGSWRQRHGRRLEPDGDAATGLGQRADRDQHCGGAAALRLGLPRR